MSFPYPPPASVRGRVLGSLLRGERMTGLDCWRRFGSSRLSGHVHVLRGLGWPIQTEESTVTTSDAGRPATVAFYSLNADSITEAGTEGQVYAATCASIERERRAA